MTKFSSAARPIMTAVLGCAASFALGLCHIAQAAVLTVTNGEFTSYSGVVPGTNGDTFSAVNPTGWTGGTGGPNGNLIFITTSNGNQQIGVNNPNLYLQVYGPTAGVTASPTNPIPNPLPGSNFVEADANPDFEDSFSYTQLSGLTVGQTYQLSFFVAYGQQTGFTGATTNQWIVGMGTAGSVFNVTFGAGNTATYAYSDTFAAANGGVATTPLTSVGSESFSGWQQVTVNLTADATNDVLTFLAWGNNGSTVNVPPIAFLDIGANGNVVSTVPEPATIVTWSLLGGLGLGISWWRRRKAA